MRFNGFSDLCLNCDITPVLQLPQEQAPRPKNGPDADNDSWQDYFQRFWKIRPALTIDIRGCRALTLAMR